MKPELKKTLVLLSLGVCLAGLLMVRSQPIVNRLQSQKLMAETDPKNRVVLINETLGYSPEFWNIRYLQCALRARADFERVFVANLIRERFGTNGVAELRALLGKDVPDSAKTNGLAVVSILQRSK